MAQTITQGLPNTDCHFQLPLPTTSVALSSQHDTGASMDKGKNPMQGQPNGPNPTSTVGSRHFHPLVELNTLNWQYRLCGEPWLMFDRVLPVRKFRRTNNQVLSLDDNGEATSGTRSANWSITSGDDKVPVMVSPYKYVA